MRASGRLAGAHEGFHRRLYDRLGSRYPRADVASVLAMLHLVSLGGMTMTLLYIKMSGAEFIRLAIAAQLAFVVVTLTAWRLAREQLRPIEQWLRGETESDVSAAWSSGVRLPFALPHAPRVLLAALVVCIGWDIYATSELGLPLSSSAVLLAASAVVFLYWTMLAFFSLEHGLRPVLDEVALALPEDPPLPKPRISLRLRLGTALPAINVITGVVVAGVFPGRGGVLDLAIGIGAALAVSASVSLWLSNLLTSSVVTPVAALRKAAGRVEQGDLDARIPVTSGDETGELAVAFNKMVEGLKRRERLREAFGAYVDPALAERVEQEDLDLSGAEADASIVFVDVRGFTAYAETASARSVVSRLNDLFECIVPIVIRYGGHANKFVGDGLMAVFGAPERRDDHAQCAVEASLEIAETVKRDMPSDLEIGIGVNSGTVIAGTIGGGGRLDFTVIGDPVNTAARVESATRETGDTVLITEATHALLQEELRGGFEERDELALKGKTERIRVFAPSRRAAGSP